MNPAQKYMVPQSTMAARKHRPVTAPMARRTPSASPRPLARATTMPPPEASAVKSSAMRPLRVFTMDTAAMAASPTEDTRAVESTPMI